MAENACADSLEDQTYLQGNKNKLESKINGLNARIAQLQASVLPFRKEEEEFQIQKGILEANEALIAHILSYWPILMARLGIRIWHSYSLHLKASKENATQHPLLHSVLL